MLQALQRQLFTNARSVPSTRSGGTHGHLAILLSPADYFLRAGVVFIVPTHPGPPPEPVGTAAVIGVALRNHAEALTETSRCIRKNVNAALTAQILLAVNASFLSALEDPDFRFGVVSPRTMLEHLRTEYGTLTPEELKTNNRAACTTLYRESISNSIQYTLLLVSNTTVVHWPCTVLGYTGRLVIQ